MGQNLFSPPNVSGWPGGEAWINTHTLLARKQFLERSLNGSPGGKSNAEAAMDDTMPASMKADEICRAAGCRCSSKQCQFASMRRVARPCRTRAGTSRAARRATKLEHAVLAVPATSPARDGSLGLDALRAVVLDPAYQLK